MNRSSLFKASGLALAIAAIAGGTNAAQLEEVIVTAQKRAESLQDVPISMTAISGDKISEANIQTMGDLSSYVPNLGISENAVNSIISMRGIGVGANQSFEQSVGVYVDGIHSFHSELPETISEEELIDVVKKYNENPDCHGILVQLPLPKHIDEEKVLGVISLEKDVDGFHPLNIGMLAMKGHEPLFMPCTPKGSIVLLERSGVELKGKNAVVVGRSNIVGMPASMMLNKKDCTVTVVHSRTKNPKEICRQADILIAAAGSAKMIKGDWIKKGAAVIDVGTNSVEDKSKKSGYALVGDVDFDEAKKRASFITPVPGGVGPMTIAMLLQNCLDGGKRAIEGTK